MNHIVDAHVAYCAAISDLSRDKTELLKRIKRLEDAGDAMVNEGWNEPHLANAWRKAKEDKL